MKIGIITFNSAHNYGAVLQVWALQEKLKSKGHDVEVINYRIPSIDNLYRVYAPKKVCRFQFVNNGIHQLQWFHAWLNNSHKAVRYKKFEHFINHVLPTTIPFRSYEELVNANLDYDVLITGSDQVWNGKYTRGLSAAYFLSFGRKEAKRISYAASIGKDHFDPEEKLVAKRYLKDLDYISVREEKARKAVSELTDKPVELVLDPTLLLDRQAYDKIKKKTKFKGDYIFVHNVHLTKIDSRLNSIVEKVSDMTGLPVVNNRGDYQFTNEIGKFDDGGPGEFIGVIEGAKYVITNSFHATVFSIIYGRNFITVPHFQNPDRMKYLLQMFGLQNHLIDNAASVPDNLRSLEIDYTQIEKKKADARVVSEQFIDSSLSGSKIVKEMQPQGVHTKQINISNAKQKGMSSLKDRSMIGRCSGGGTSYALAKVIWNKGGAVVGCSLDAEQLPYYRVALKPEEASDFFKNKLTMADTTDIFPVVKQLLDENKAVMFMGTSCVVSQLYEFLGRDYDQLYTVENKCRGMIVRDVYDRYLRSLENQFSSKICNIDWDNKTKSANTPYVCVEFENKETYVDSCRGNLLLRAKRRGMVFDYDCYSCGYRCNQMSEADIIVDSSFDGVEVSDEGEDIYMVNTDKGMGLLHDAETELCLKGLEVIPEESPLTLKVERNIFMNELDKGEDEITLLKKMLAKRVVF